MNLANSLYADPNHAPFRLGESAYGALLIHGFLGSPGEMRHLGATLSGNGWRVRGPAMPGFGRDIDRLPEITCGDWLDAARQEWNSLSNLCETTTLIGYSLGSAVALCLAAETLPARLVLRAPFWFVPPVYRLVLTALHKVKPISVEPFKALDFDEPKSRAFAERFVAGMDLSRVEVQDALRIFRLPVSAFYHAARLGAKAAGRIGRVRSPTLVIQGRDDPVVRRQHTRRLIGRLKNANVSYWEVPGKHDLLEPTPSIAPKIGDIVLSYVDQALTPLE